MALVNTKMVLGVRMRYKENITRNMETWGDEAKNMHQCGDRTKWIYKYTEIQT